MTSPFVLFKNKVTSVSGNVETIIFSNSNTSIIDSIFIVNIFTKPILVKLILNKADGDSINSFIFRQWFVVDSLDYKEIIAGSTLIVEPTDTITAISKVDTNNFNTFVSYRALTELV